MLSLLFPGHNKITCQPLERHFCLSHETFTDDALITQTCDSIACKKDHKKWEETSFAQWEKRRRTSIETAATGKS